MNWLDLEPYGAPAKARVFAERLRQLDRHHRTHCPIYARVAEQLFAAHPTRLEDFPFLPVSLFRQHRLSSVPPEQVFKVLHSSGTGGNPSQVVLDAPTAACQTRVLVKLGQHFLGTARRPLVIVDHPGILRSAPSARQAGVVGMMQFGKKPFFCLNEGLELDEAGLRAYLKSAQAPLFFGLTFLVWARLLERLEEPLTAGGTLVHTGGWKRLQDQAVSAAEFAARARERLGVEQVINFYGMAEQVGSIFWEGPTGGLEISSYSEVIVRNPADWRPLPPGQTGVLQLLSLLSESYPGHSLLTEDLGRLVDGRLEVLGRVPQVELRGCSDTLRVP